MATHLVNLPHLNIAPSVCSPATSPKPSSLYLLTLIPTKKIKFRCQEKKGDRKTILRENILIPRGCQPNSLPTSFDAVVRSFLRFRWDFFKLHRPPWPKQMSILLSFQNIQQTWLFLEVRFCPPPANTLWYHWEGLPATEPVGSPASVVPMDRPVPAGYM